MQSIRTARRLRNHICPRTRPPSFVPADRGSSILIRMNIWFSEITGRTALTPGTGVFSGRTRSSVSHACGFGLFASSQCSQRPNIEIHAKEKVFRSAEGEPEVLSSAPGYARRASRRSAVVGPGTESFARTRRLLFVQPDRNADTGTRRSFY